MRNLQRAFEDVFKELPSSKYKSYKPNIGFSTLAVERGDEEWTYDNFDEFVLDINTPYEVARATLFTSFTDDTLQISMSSYKWTARTKIDIFCTSRAPLLQLASLVDQIMQKYGCHADSSPPVVFIGHGQSSMWRDLRDHLKDKHGFQVECFEGDARAGTSIIQVLDNMLSASSVALLVMTAEDEMLDGAHRARQNVIHEIGLFQGRHGFDRVIVLKEEGVEDFSNLAGIVQIRFKSGNIKETFGEVLAAIRRVFEQNHPSTRQ
jgi:hypothetical protein